MSTYKILFFNDMGHLNTQSNLPSDLKKKVYNQIYNDCIELATDIKNKGATFYLIKEGVEKTGMYTFGNETVEVIFELPYFNSTCMKKILN